MGKEDPAGAVGALGLPPRGKEPWGVLSLLALTEQTPCKAFCPTRITLVYFLVVSSDSGQE